MHIRWKPEWTSWLAAAGASGLVATWLAGSERFHQYDADSLVPRLTSTMEWSFYYWHTSRNGQLLPLLAMPFTHPLTNLVVQQWLGTFAGVMAIYLLVALAMRGRDWFVSGTVAVACFLVGAASFGHTLYLEGSQTYGTALSLVLGGVLLARRALPWRENWRRIAVAALLVTAGLWVNLMVFLFAAAVVAVDAALPEGDPPPEPLPEMPLLRNLPRLPPAVLRWIVRAGVAMAVLVGCLAFMLIATKLFASSGGERRATFSLVPLSSYPGAVATAAYKTCDMVVGPGGAVLVAAAAVAAAWLEGRGAWPRGVTVLATAAFGFFACVGGMQWVAMNASHPRYLLPATISAFACIGIVFAKVVQETLGPVLQARRELPWARLAVTAAVPAALFLGYGWPDAGAAHRAIARIGSPMAEKVVESGVEFVAGDYWSLWPVVFRANLILYERGEQRRVWGLGFRAGAARHRWEATVLDGGATVAHLPRTSPRGDHDLRWIAEHLDLEIGDHEGAFGDLELHRFRLRDGRIARR